MIYFLSHFFLVDTSNRDENQLAETSPQATNNLYKHHNC